MYGSVPGGQADQLRVPQAQYRPIKIGTDARVSSTCSYLTSCPPHGRNSGTPTCPFATRSGRHLGHRVSGVDPVPERATAQRRGIETLDPSAIDDVPGALADMAGGRGPDSFHDAVWMEAHGQQGWPSVRLTRTAAGRLPDALAQKVFGTAGGTSDRAAGRDQCGEARRRRVGQRLVGGSADLLSMVDVFDRQIQPRM